MAFRVEVAERNYELEGIKQKMQGKRIYENPLGGAKFEEDEYGNRIKPKDNEGLFGSQSDVSNSGYGSQSDMDDDNDEEGVFAKLEQEDPMAEYLNFQDRGNTDFVPWSEQKLKIFAKFKALTDDQEFIVDDKKGSIERQLRMGKGKNRAQELNVKDIVGQTKGQGMLLSAQEFTAQLEKLKVELQKAWDKQDKVQSFRIAIQCAKLLNDQASPLFYPQKFILLTDILDSYGQLVLERMRNLTKENSNGQLVITDLNENEIDYALIPDKVQDICRNWFMKSACIRECLPRLYLDLALAPISRYRQTNIKSSDLVRLAKQIRGIAEPLTAVYSCAYLARVGNMLSPGSKDYLILMVEFILKLLNKMDQIGNPTYLDDAQYIGLYEPPLDWVFQCLGYGATKKIFGKIYEMYENSSRHVLILKAIIRYFPGEIVASATTSLIVAVKEHHPVNEDKLKLLKEMGINLLTSPPKKQQPRLDFINFSWETMSTASNAEKYMDCAIVLTEFAIVNLNPDSVNIFIKEIFRKLQDFALSTTQDPNQFKRLEFLLVKVMSTAKDFSELIGFENLLALLHYFPVSVKNKLCEKMLNFFVENNTVLSDGFLIHSIFQIAKTLHDKIDSMSEETEIERVSLTISKLVQMIDFGIDLDKTLNVLTTARGYFINLDKVTQMLIIKVNNLAAKTHQIVNAKHTQKTKSFVKACIAYNHITIPSLIDPDMQLKFFLMTAHTAMLNGLVGETESLVKAFLTAVDENWSREEAKVLNAGRLIQSLLGLIVVLPDNPDQQYFQMIDGIMNIVKEKDWGNSGEVQILKARIILSCAYYLSSQAQNQLPYHIPNVDSNDAIFVGNAEFKKECNSLIDYVFEQLVEQLETLGTKSKEYLPFEFELSLSIANFLANNCVHTKQIDKFINKMFKKAHQAAQEGEKYNLGLSAKYVDNCFYGYKKKKDAGQKPAITPQ